MVMVNLALYWASGASGTLVSGDIAARCQGGAAAVSPADAAGAVLSLWQAVFCVGSGNGKDHGSAGAYAGGGVTGGAIISLLFAAAGGRRASWRFWRRVCSWGQLGLLGLLRLGMERYPATPEPLPVWFGLPDT